jgi:hypothetical protein
MPVEAELVALPSGRRLHLDKEKTYIGRNPDNDIVADERHVSRRHCAVVKNGACFFLEDLKSSNGTYINGRRIEETVWLRKGDTISFGRKLPAYQFHTHSSFAWKMRNLIKNPMHSAFIAAAAFLLLGLFYARTFIPTPRSGSIEARNGLLRLERVHGAGILPSDPALMSAVEKWIEKVKQDEALRPTLEWRLHYKDMIESTLKANNLSTDYELIVWAESLYDQKARNSRTGAAGMWQLLPSTARAYGLRVDQRVDERLNPVRSTQAAALYLKDLVSIFGNDSFLLVLAAYNAGDNAVLYGLKQIEDPVKDRNFWYLYSHDLIPAETKAYVMKILALAIVEEET